MKYADRRDSAEARKSKVLEALHVIHLIKLEGNFQECWENASDLPSEFSTVKADRLMQAHTCLLHTVVQILLFFN